MLFKSILLGHIYFAQQRLVNQFYSYRTFKFSRLETDQMERSKLFERQTLPTL